MRIVDLPAIYINMDHDEARRASAERTLQLLGFKNVIRAPGVPAQPYWVGCAAAHHAALSIVPPPFIIFEDDIAVCEPCEEIAVPTSTERRLLRCEPVGAH